MQQTQSPRSAMRGNPFIVHEFFCARRKGTRRHCMAEQIRIVRAQAQKAREDQLIGFCEVP
jgi:hypothetical protein